MVFCLFVDGIDEVTLNLSRLTFIDATGLRALLAVLDLCEHEECRFSLTRPVGQVRRLFELTGAMRTLPIESGGSLLGLRLDSRRLPGFIEARRRRLRGRPSL